MQKSAYTMLPKKLDPDQSEIAAEQGLETQELVRVANGHCKGEESTTLSAPNEPHNQTQEALEGPSSPSQASHATH